MQQFLGRGTELNPTAESKPGYIEDFLSGSLVKGIPEEIEAVQVFAKRLVEEYGYPKAHIQTHPQYRVRKSPSDEEKTYPVDIAVFKEPNHTENNLIMVIACKKKTRKDGLAQLMLYLDLSSATVGVWFNGKHHVYIRKVYHKDGTRTYQPLPNIPRLGQRIEDVGMYKRKELVKPSNLKSVFKDIRNHLAGMTTGITRDEALAQEIINLLFCKIYDEQERFPDETVIFRAGVGEASEEVRHRILRLFDKVKRAFLDVFHPDETIKLDAESLTYVVGELQTYCVMDADRDAVSDAFEVFIGPALRGAEGQFFTPRNAVRMIVDILDPKPTDTIIDPACGSGGFLVTALEHVWAKLREEAKAKGWSDQYLAKREGEMATANFRGLEKDAFLAKVSKAYMALMGDGKGGVFCENSLATPSEWSRMTQEKIRPGTFDVIMTNPPFGAEIKVKGQEILSQYELGYKWIRGDDGKFERTDALKPYEAPQVLFIERCIQLLKPGGRMGIILPEGILGNRTTGYILDVLRKHGQIVGIVDITRHLFQPSTDTKTNVLIYRKHEQHEQPKDSPLIFSVVKTCGHDKRGREIYQRDGAPDDELPLAAQAWHSPKPFNPSRLGYLVPSTELDPYYLVPRYYTPEVTEAVADLEQNGKVSFRSIDALSQTGIIAFSSGHEIGSNTYGTGEIPFIRTSDIANFEITHDPTFSVSEEIYSTYAQRQGLKPHDILFVNDGRYRIGNVAILTEYDTRILVQSHFTIIRVLKQEQLDPFLLLYLLKHPVVRLQIESKTFIQSTIATIGTRYRELVLPFPKDPALLGDKVASIRRIVLERARLRNEAAQFERYDDGF